MKSMMVIFSMICMAQSAFATTYNCELLNDTGYQIRFARNGNVQLIETHYGPLVTLHGPRRRVVEMEKTFQGVDGATYEADGITFESMNGILSISEGNDTAACH